MLIFHWFIGSSFQIFNVSTWNHTSVNHSSDTLKAEREAVAALQIM